MNAISPETQAAGRLAEALSKAQASFAPIVKNRTAKVRMKSGGEYSYNYADLSDVIDAVKGPLAQNGLAHSQRVNMRDGAMVLVTKLLHVSGEYEESEWPLPGAGSPQEMGSALTYARRYSLCAILGVAAEEDDDGQAGQNTTPQQSKPMPQKQEPAKPQQNAGNRPFALITCDGEEKTFARGGEYLAAMEKEFQSAPDKLGFWDSNRETFEGWHSKLVKLGNNQQAVADFARIGKDIADTVFLLQNHTAG